MFFEIDNIGKVKNARLEMRGVTVLAGNNNTGKSTFGKALFSIFNAFFESEKTIKKERKNNIEKILSPFLSPQNYRPNQATKITNDILTNIDLPQKILHLIRDNIEQQIIVQSRMGKNSEEILFEKIKNAIAISDEQIQKNILTKYLRSEFDDQITHINHSERHGLISLTIKNSKLETDIYKNECTNYSDEIGVIYKAFYIDTPFIIDAVDQRFNNYPKYSRQRELLQSLSATDEENNLVETEILRQ
ncbi:MAG: ATP-binding protein, partial [Planctomycetaceae bacterium]|nr:ATP-binding protein [Planctomycetaceae bacterium]